jgi:hypothetical protein
MSIRKYNNYFRQCTLKNYLSNKSFELHTIVTQEDY